MFVHWDSSIVNKFGASLTDDARVVIYDHHMFKVWTTGLPWRVATEIGFTRVRYRLAGKY